MDIHIVKRFMLTLADSEGKIWLSDFVSKYFNSESGEKRDVMREDEQKRASEVGVIRLLIKPECYNVYRQFFLWLVFLKINFGAPLQGTLHLILL